MEQGTFERLNHVEVEVIALDIGAAFLGHELLRTVGAYRVPADHVAFELAVDISQSELSDPSDPARREFEPITPIDDIASIFQQRLHARNPIEILPRILPQEPLQQLGVYILQVHARELAFQAAQLLDPV